MKHRLLIIAYVGIILTYFVACVYATCLRLSEIPEDRSTAEQRVERALLEASEKVKP